MNYFVCGETINDEFVEFEFEGDYDDCVDRAKEVLEEFDGGHLDIFILHNDHDEFMGDVEV